MPDESTSNSTGGNGWRIESEKRLFDLMDRWTREAAQTTERLRSIQDLEERTANALIQINQTTDRLEGLAREHSAVIAGLQQNCNGVWEQANRLQGLKGFLDWFLIRAKDNPMAMAMLVIVLVFTSLLLTILGWDVPSYLGVK